jgi:hypothetical protein
MTLTIAVFATEYDKIMILRPFCNKTVQALPFMRMVQSGTSSII